MEVVWSDLAVSSFYNILDYVQKSFGKRVANSVAIKILSFTESLGNTPFLGRNLSHLIQYGEIRCAFYKQNRIYYRILESQVEIIIVWDGRQDPSKLKCALSGFLNKKS